MLYPFPCDSMVALELHGSPDCLSAIHFLFRSCQTAGTELRPLRPATAKKWGSSLPPLCKSTLSLHWTRGAGGVMRVNDVPSPLIHDSEASTSPIFPSWTYTNVILQEAVKRMKQFNVANGEMN